MKILSSKSRGVTLVELSIVLAILGILIVATVSGKSLIDMARATATIQYFKDRSVAMQLFDASYSALPGDATYSSIADLQPTLYGDGSKGINTFPETVAVDYHFSKAKLYTRSIPDSAITGGTSSASGTLATPSAILTAAKVSGSNVFTVSKSETDHFHAIGAISALVGYNTVSSPMFKIVDTKTDDGVYNTGYVKCYKSIAFTLTAYTTLVDQDAITGYDGECILGQSTSM